MRLHALAAKCVASIWMQTSISRSRRRRSGSDAAEKVATPAGCVGLLHPGVKEKRVAMVCSRMNYCAYRQSYTEGSSIEGAAIHSLHGAGSYTLGPGFRFTDYASLGDEFQENPPVRARLAN